ncbi:MAG: hypothetical protein QNJ46_05295 [Leptolyngbyaceae cyanobacterium MO_188.B28]|nr:hypothetical protein [Leptolyngbyaceae cyanobacterium MO_188.B28]
MQLDSGNFKTVFTSPGDIFIEAENYTASTAANGQKWRRINDKAASGGTAVQAGSDKGVVYPKQDLANSPRLDYTVNFDKAGVYYVWARGKGVGNLKDSDSVFFGLDGKVIDNSRGLKNFGLPYSWTNDSVGQSPVAVIKVTQPGEHTLNLWTREDGFVLDSLLLTQDANRWPSDTQAVQADRFIDSIGVAVHLSYYDTSYGDFNRVKNALDFLGVRHIRDDLKPGKKYLDRVNALNQQGIKLTAIVPSQPTSVEDVLTRVKAAGDAVEAIEGPNETDIFNFSYNGQQSIQGTRAFMHDFYNALQTDPLLGDNGRDIPLIQTSVGHEHQKNAAGLTYAELLGDLSAYADYGNSHNYFKFGAPPSKEINSIHIADDAALVTPGKPLISTEGGYHTATAVNNVTEGLPDDIHGRYMTRYLLEQFTAGYERSFVYELLDLKPDPENDDAKFNWGLFETDGTPKLAAKGIANLIDLLADPGDAFTPDSLNYSLQGMPEAGNSLFLQKRDGSFLLVLWNDADNWDEKANKPIYYDDVPVKLALQQPIGRIRTYRPLTNGVTPLKTYRNIDQVTLQVPDHPLVIELTPEKLLTPPTSPNPTPNPNENFLIQGTSKDDILNGSERNETIEGFGGDDVIKAHQGDDKLYGEIGRDTLYGGAGRDQLFGDDGRDELFGGANNDELHGGKGHDQLNGNKGNDSLFGENGNDRLDGGNGADTLVGVRPKDIQAGLRERDTLLGGDGSDTFVLGDSSQVFYDDHKNNTAGLHDYAIVKDFFSSQGDKIQLSGKAKDYRLGQVANVKGTGIFLKTPGQDELIGVVQGDKNLSLNSTDFHFV